MDNYICARVTLRRFGKFLIFHSFRSLNRAPAMLKCRGCGCQKTLLRRSMWSSAVLIRSDRPNISLGRKKCRKLCAGNYGNPGKGTVTNLSWFAQDLLVFSTESTETSSASDKWRWLVILEKASNPAKAFWRRWSWTSGLNLQVRKGQARQGCVVCKGSGWGSRMDSRRRRACGSREAVQCM